MGARTQPLGWNKSADASWEDRVRSHQIGEARARKISNIDLEAFLINGTTSGQLVAGVNLTPTVSMQADAVWACVQLLQRTLGSMTAHVYKRASDGSHKRAIDRNHPVYPIIHKTPNPEMTKRQWFGMMQPFLELRGNAYAEKEFDMLGNIKALWPLHPDFMDIKRVDDKKIYTYTLPNGQQKTFRADQILHIWDYSDDGLKGIGPIQACAPSIAPGLAARIYGGQWFENGAQPSILIQPPDGQRWKPEDADALEKTWNDNQRGLSNAQRVSVLHKQIKIDKLTVTAEDAQFLETIKASTTQIARIFGVPPHMIGDHTSGAPKGNTEQQSMDYVMYSVLPRTKGWEEIYDVNLFTEAEQKIWFVEFMLDSLLRADTKTRYEAYQLAAGGNAPFMTRNEIRDFENMPPIDGLDEMLEPFNMGAAAPQEPSRPKKPKGPPQDGDVDTKS